MVVDNKLLSAERTLRICKLLATLVVILTNVGHAAADEPIRITDRVWEFASGPHSSTNHSAPHEANRPPNGWYQSGPRRCDIRWSSYVPPAPIHYLVTGVGWDMIESEPSEPVPLDRPR